MGGYQVLDRPEGTYPYKRGFGDVMTDFLGQMGKGVAKGWTDKMYRTAAAREGLVPEVTIDEEGNRKVTYKSPKPSEVDEKAIAELLKTDEFKNEFQPEGFTVGKVHYGRKKEETLKPSELHNQLKAELEQKAVKDGLESLSEAEKFIVGYKEPVIKTPAEKGVFELDATTGQMKEMGKVPAGSTVFKKEKAAAGGPRSYSDAMKQLELEALQQLDKGGYDNLTASQKLLVGQKEKKETGKTSDSEKFRTDLQQAIEGKKDWNDLTQDWPDRVETITKMQETYRKRALPSLEKSPEFVEGGGIKAWLSPNRANINDKTRRVIEQIKNEEDLQEFIDRKSEAESKGIDVDAILEYFGKRK